MTYTTFCPHCRQAVRAGHGSPTNRIDTPFQQCPHCKQYYVDNNCFEWAAITLDQKLFYMFFSNMRFIVPWMGILGISIALQSWIAFLVCIAIWIAGCVFYVYKMEEDEVAASKKRCLDADYVRLLADSPYEKFDETLSWYTCKHCGCVTSVPNGKDEKGYCCAGCNQPLFPIEVPATGAIPASVKVHNKKLVRFWGGVKVTLALWGATLLGPVVIAIWNAISTIIGYGYATGSLGYTVLTFLAQPFSNLVAFFWAKSISQKEHDTCLLINSLLQIVLLGLLAIITRSAASSASLGISAVVTGGCVVYMFKELIDEVKNHKQDSE